MNTTTSYEVVEGTRINPGRVLKTFTSADRASVRVGGPATACLRWWDTASRRTGAPSMFFRKVH